MSKTLVEATAKQSACWNHKGSGCPHCDGSGYKPYTPKPRKRRFQEYGGLTVRSDPK